MNSSLTFRWPEAKGRFKQLIILGEGTAFPVLWAALLISALSSAVQAEPRAIFEVSLKEAQAEVHQKNYRRAKLLYNRLIREEPSNVEALSELAKLENRLGNPVKAKKYGEKALQLDQSNRIALTTLAYVATRNQNWQRAASYYRSLVEYHPNVGSAYMGLAQAYKELGQFEKEQTALAQFHQWRQQP